MNALLQIHTRDNVAVALSPLQKGESARLGEEKLVCRNDIPFGHKIALTAIKTGEEVIKYGNSIGHAAQDIAPGDWVHTHNLVTGLSGQLEYSYTPNKNREKPDIAYGEDTFMGFYRADGKVGVRNGIWIIPTVACVNKVAAEIARRAQSAVHGSVDSVTAFSHDAGCAQMGEDQEDLRKIIAGLAHHPNAGGVLIVGLGCENSRIDVVKEYMRPYDEARVRFLNCQDEDDELAVGEAIARELIDQAAGDTRSAAPVSELIVGVNCGGSDGLSGITANPVIGRFSDILLSKGGANIMTEVPEMFGAENMLMDLCETEEVFGEVTAMLNGFKQYLLDNGQTVYENPTPGNKDGGISTLEDKSLGCTQKAGRAPIAGVIPYAGQIKGRGLHLLCCPAFDPVSTTAQVAAGAQIIVFSTGRGTPFSSPVPTLKMSTNTPLAEKKRNWIDFDAGVVLAGESLDDLGRRLYDKVILTACGSKVKSETMAYYDMALFRHGVTL